tara:strand:- start:1020 stop:1199 length:180 start_codon:yes stop_codon:yes gene_type:complete
MSEYIFSNGEVVEAIYINGEHHDNVNHGSFEDFGIDPRDNFSAKEDKMDAWKLENCWCY